MFPCLLSWFSAGFSAGSSAACSAGCSAGFSLSGLFTPSASCCSAPFGVDSMCGC